MPDPRIKLLTFDKMIKIYFLCEFQTPTKLPVLSETEEESVIVINAMLRKSSYGSTSLTLGIVRLLNFCWSLGDIPHP